MSFAADLQNRLNVHLNTVDRELEKYPALNKLQAQTGVPKSYGVIGFVFIYFFLIFLNAGGIGQLLANFASLVIPGYYSLQALESRSTADDTQYLTYWVVYAALSVLEFWTNTILYWVPFYWFFKTIFFLYIGLPHFGGSRYIYANFIRPFSVKVLGITGAPAHVAPVAPTTSSALKEKIEEATTSPAASDIGASTSVSL